MVALPIRLMPQAARPGGARAPRPMSEPGDPNARFAGLWPRMLERRLENVAPGAHICPIYRTPTDRLRVLMAFFGGGLRHGEQCLYFADAHLANEVAQALQALGSPARTELERGGMVVVT